MAHKESLHSRIALVVGVGALVIGLLSSLLIYQSNFKRELSSSRHQTEQLVATIETSASVAAYLGNEMLAAEVLAGLNNNDLVLSSAIEDESEFNVQLKPWSKPGGVISFPLAHPFMPEEKIGRLIVEINQPSIEENAASVAKTQAIFALVLSTIISCMVLFLVNRILTKPLTSIARQLHVLEPGTADRLHSFDSHKEDEIDYLVQDINKLLETTQMHIEKERDLRDRADQLQKKFRLIYEAASAGICLVDSDNVILEANPAFQFLTAQGSAENDPTHNNKSTLTSLVDYFDEPSKIEELLEKLRMDISDATIDLDLRLLGASEYWLHCLFTKVVDESGREFVEVIAYDVTQRMVREQHSVFEANHDPLTLLLNRRAGGTKMAEILDQALEAERRMVVLLIDLDHFKPVNDTHGHEAGDHVLKVIANRIRSLFRRNDVVARWGGDEFLVAFEDIDTSNDRIRYVCDNIISSLQEPIELSSGGSCIIGCSVGVSIAKTHGSELGILIEQADKAMYSVKQEGRNSYAIF